MQKYNFIPLCLLSMLTFLASNTLCSQNESEITKVIDRLFDGMRAGDSTMVTDLFTPEAALSSVIVNKDKQVVKKGSPASRFISAIGQPRTDVWDEQIWSYDIKIDEPMAQVWTEYTFYVNDDLSHCGVNVFEMIHLSDGWKISNITDTRRKTNCKTKEERDINTLMDNWHLAAANADEDIFFGSMTNDAVYIGTDATERWLRDEMREWSKEIFERESAWAFSTLSRNVQLSEDGKIGWFDELLDTWMGDCRGSGVIVMTEEGWKIRHYHLAMAVPNDQVDGYLELIGKPRKK